MCLDSVFYTNTFCAFLFFWTMPGGVPGSALGISPGGLEGTMWVVGGIKPQVQRQNAGQGKRPTCCTIALVHKCFLFSP